MLSLSGDTVKSRCYGYMIFQSPVSVITPEGYNLVKTRYGVTIGGRMCYTECIVRSLCPAQTRSNKCGVVDYPKLSGTPGY